MTDQPETLFKTKVWVSLRTKFILLFLILLAATIFINIHYATLEFTKDKTSYIYETGINKSHILKSRLKEVILRVVDNSITLGNVLQNTKIEKVKMELGNDSIALSILDYSTGQQTIKRSIINDKLMGEIIDRYNIDRPKLLQDSLKLFDSQYNPNKKINVISTLNKLQIPILLIGVKKDNTSFYVTFFNIEPLATDLESDSIYTNIILSDRGTPIYSKSKQNLAKEEYVQDIIRTKVLNSAKKVTSTDGIEKLVSYSKLPEYDLIVLSEIGTEKAFQVINDLKRKGIFFGLFILGIAIILVLLISLTITKPIEKLVKGISQLASGDFTARVKLFALDETRVLASAFNYMAAKITELINEMLEKARLQKEIENARIIQEALLPDTTAKFDDIIIEGLYESATECSGDWWFYETIGRNVYFFIGDATGHGVPAALLTTSVRATLATLDKDKPEQLTPSFIMKKMNYAVSSTSRSKVFMTFFIAQYNLDTRELTYSNASHNAPYIMPLKKELGIKDLTPLDDSENPRLGEYPDHEFTEVKIQTKKKDMLLMYTDGVIELENPAGKQLGEKKFLKLVLEGINTKRNVGKTIEFVKEKVDEYGGENFYEDDITYYIGYFG